MGIFNAITHKEKNDNKVIIHSVNILETKVDDLSFYTNDYTYRTIFGKHFYNLQETGLFNVVDGVSGVVINGMHPDLVLGSIRFLEDYSPTNGLNLSSGTHIQTEDTFNQNTSFTFAMSFLHDKTKTCEIGWVTHGSNQEKYFPKYRITSDKLQIDADIETFEKTFTSDFQDKLMLIWIAYDGANNTYRLALSNYASSVQETFPPPETFQSSQIEINYDGYVKKVAFIDKFIDIDTVEFHRILLEEKRNGTYLE